MVKHIIIWTLKDSLSAEEKIIIKQTAKKNLEALVGKIDGLTEMKIQIDLLPTSSGEMMLNSTFTSLEALHAYATHPAHQEVANRDVRPYIATRSCADFEI